MKEPIELTEAQWEHVADYVQRVAWLAYYHGATREYIRRPSELRGEYPGGDEAFGVRADDYTRSGFDGDVVRRYCLTNPGRLSSSEVAGSGGRDR